jgi:hypothetical protein
MMMLTRRQALRAGGAAMAAASYGRDAGATPWGPRSPVDFALPARACDSHVHIVGDPVRFPMAPDRVYTPPRASPDMLLELQRDLHLDRVVLIQPSFYGWASSAAGRGASRSWAKTHPRRSWMRWPKPAYGG